ncbi:unnamed protein product [Cylindrotheca closterium]|uniref:Integrase zinc-binding domain-containing protein n=1 Tax=Cylindrotheca closterium TaxID=2856 RepID=A0AAD2G8Y3_9STRA|nr:unnamed protein product [Cylindrotheca closterium]
MYARPKHAKKHLTAIVSRSINPFTTLPIPTGEDWREKCNGDPDISHIIKAIRNNKKVDRSKLTNPTYASELNRDKLEIENGILYQFEEPKSAPMRQLRRAVVPPRLRATIIAAYHASPMAGHVGFHKTYYRIAARFWWPGMAKDIREAVLGCGHCNAANASSHKNQKILQQTPIEEPFDVAWTFGRQDQQRTLPNCPQL